MFSLWKVKNQSLTLTNFFYLLIFYNCHDLKYFWEICFEFNPISLCFRSYARSWLNIHVWNNLLLKVMFWRRSDYIQSEWRCLEENLTMSFLVSREGSFSKLTICIKFHFFHRILARFTEICIKIHQRSSTIKLPIFYQMKFWAFCFIVRFTCFFPQYKNTKNIHAFLKINIFFSYELQLSSSEIFIFVVFFKQILEFSYSADKSWNSLVYRSRRQNTTNKIDNDKKTF